MAIIKTIISPKPLWSIFGNTEEPDPPDWYLPDKAQWQREAMWYFIRNPLHNFSWHIIGIVDEIDENVWEKSGLYPNHIWNPNSGWNVITYNHKKTGGKRYFKSYRGKWIELYFGVRYNGAYGISLRRRDS